MNERDQRELEESVLLNNKYLAELVRAYGHDAVVRASVESIGYPANMVATHKEAMQISQYLSQES